MSGESCAIACDMPTTVRENMQIGITQLFRIMPPLDADIAYYSANYGRT